MALGQALQAQGCVQPCPLCAQHGDGVALFADFLVQPQYALGAGGRLHLDAVDVGSSEHQRADYEQVDDPHDQPPLIATESRGQAGKAALACAAAAVRSAARSFADRARGLSAISCSLGASGRLVRMRKLGATCLTSGKCRDPPLALPRSARKFLTIRSSSEWNETTASRPPGLSTRSAASSARCSSSSSSLTRIRSAWKVRVAG